MHTASKNKVVSCKHVRVGLIVSKINTVKLHESILPFSLVAFKVTKIVSVDEKVELGAGICVMDEFAQPPETAAFKV